MENLNKTPNQVRIIAGKWRGRTLKVPEIMGLRPTPDRVRETLFNWLAPVIVDARCLDPFAGSGALGFEALSRGAAYVEMVDQSSQLIKLLQEERSQLGANNADIYCASAPAGLKKTAQPFDIIFLDPPYDSDLLLITCQYLHEHHFLAKNAYIYLEARYIIKDNDLPSGWRLLKSQRAGQVYYHLAQKQE
jgi:16S rRNA (guanine966-N2)-methyltransferase